MLWRGRLLACSAWLMIQQAPRLFSKRVNRIKLIPAEIAEISLDGKALEVRYNPGGEDLQGRPSSAAVARFLENSL